VAATDKHPRPAGQTTGPGGILTLRELTEQTLLKQIAPAGALVNGQGDLLYIHGRTGLYLEPAPGDAGVNNILKMAREGLRRDLITALHKAAVGKETVRCPRLRVKTNGDFTTVDLTVHPVAAVPAATTEVPLYLVVLEEAPDPELVQKVAALQAAAGADGTVAMDADARVVALKQELQAKEEYLQAANEELETSNEELKSSNEEMQSVNEELQSTNEELETSKEELQSVNEELATVNAELQTKVADLSRANNDMNNLLAGTGIGTVFVDHILRILRFTPAATPIINLILSDVGRPVGHIVSNLVGYDRIVADTQSVLDSLIPKEVEVQTQAGAWYQMRILPYRTLDNVIEGAVITFIDISEIKKARDQWRESEMKFRSLFENTASAIALHEIVLDEQGRPVDCVFVEVNPAFERLTGLRAAEVLGKRVTQIYPGAEKTDLIATYGQVALAGAPASFELFFRPRQCYYQVRAYQVGPKRIATVLDEKNDRGLQDPTQIKA
jgi:two-component system CheB/CheR fusion protein